VTVFSLPLDFLDTPSVIRFRNEAIVYKIPTAKFVRINLQYPDVPEEFEGRAIGIQSLTGTVWQKLAELRKQQ